MEQGSTPPKIIHVIATFEVKEGKRDEFIAAFNQLLPHVKAEKGCIEYGPLVDIQTAIPIQDPIRPNHVIISEKWESLEALNAHLQRAHMNEFFANHGPLTNGVKIQVLQNA